MELPKATLELDAFELGCIYGLLANLDKDDPIAIHLTHRILALSRPWYLEEMARRRAVNEEAHAVGDTGARRYAEADEP